MLYVSEDLSQGLIVETMSGWNSRWEGTRLSPKQRLQPAMRWLNRMYGVYRDFMIRDLNSLGRFLTERVWFCISW